MQYRDTRRVAIIGGNRIPFCRSYTGYLQQSNLDMMTAALSGLVERFHLENKQLGNKIHQYAQVELPRVTLSLHNILKENDCHDRRQLSLC